MGESIPRKVGESILSLSKQQLRVVDKFSFDYLYSTAKEVQDKLLNEKKVTLINSQKKYRNLNQQLSSYVLYQAVTISY